MKKTYSENDIIRFLYQETSHQENVDLSYLVEDHAKMNETYHIVTMAKAELDKLILRPSTKSISNILAFAGA